MNEKVKAEVKRIRAAFEYSSDAAKIERLERENTELREVRDADIKSLVESLDKTGTEKVGLQEENAKLRAEIERLRKQNRPVIHIGKDHSAYDRIKDLADILVLDPVELEPGLPPLPDMILEPVKLCGTPRNRQERRHGRR